MRASGQRYVPRVLRQSSANTPARFIDFTAAAADAISQACLVERLIRGANQEWSLAPTHALLSSILPAAYVHGSFAPGTRLDFPAWFGQNSRQGKNHRLLRLISGHLSMRHSESMDGRGGPGMIATSRVTRQEFLPFLARFLAAKLQVGDIDGAIAMLDECCLTKDDADAMWEVLCDSFQPVKDFKALPASSKTTFTRQYCPFQS